MTEVAQLTVPSHFILPLNPSVERATVTLEGTVKMTGGRVTEISSIAELAQLTLRSLIPQC